MFVPRIFGCEEFAVLSGSMVPTIPVGSLVVDKKADNASIEVGDIVTYQISEETLVTHRITAIDEAAKTVTTKGDANNVEDGAPVPFSSIIGVYAFHVPYVGYISIYGKTPLGISGLCGVLIVVILLNFLPDALSSDGEEKHAIKED